MIWAFNAHPSFQLSVQSAMAFVHQKIAPVFGFIWFHCEKTEPERVETGRERDEWKTRQGHSVPWAHLKVYFSLLFPLLLVSSLSLFPSVLLSVFSFSSPLFLPLFPSHPPPFLSFLSSSFNLPPCHLFFSISSIQLYDLGSPADSHSSSPGCLTTDSSCVNMGYPSCGHRGRCHGEWGSFSCQCVPGYTGHQCEEGKQNLFWIYAILYFIWQVHHRNSENHYCKYENMFLYSQISQCQTKKWKYVIKHTTWKILPKHKPKITK